MKKHDVKIQGHGFFRKTKVGLASGIVLGAALVFGANAVSADEATVGNTANVANVATQAGNEAKPVEKPAEVTKIENTQTPSDKADADGTYNSQVKSIEATNVDEAANKVRYRVEFHDNHAIPKDGAVKFDVTGATQYPEANDLYIDKTKVGTIKTYPGKPANQEYANDLANTETLKEFKEKVKEASSETILGTTKAELKFNEEFAKMNKNRAVEFTLSNYNYHVYTGNFPTLYVKEGDKVNVFEGDTDKKVFKNNLSLPSVKNKVLAAPTSKVHYPVQALETKPSDVKYMTTAIYSLAPAKSTKDLNLPIYLQGVGYNGTLSFRSVDGPFDDREVMFRNQTNGDTYYVKKGDVLTLKTQDPSKQLFDLEIPYKVGDIVEGSEVVTTKTAGSKENRFTDSNLYAKTAESGVTRTPVKLKVVEVNNSGIRFEVQDDVKLENGTFSRFNFDIPAKKFALRLADNWLDRFGEDNLKKLLAGKESRTRLDYKEGHGIDVTLERDGKTIADHKGYTVLDKNTNLTFGESTKGTVKVRYVDENMKEIPGYPTETVLDNKPWYTSVTITPKTIKDYEYQYATAPLKTIAGSGEQVISLVYKAPVSNEVPDPKVNVEEIPFKEVIVENPSKPEGYRAVLKEGKIGKKTTTTTYSVDPKTGVVTPNEPTVTIVKAEDALIEVGTGKDFVGEIETRYVPDIELEFGKTKIVQNGTPEVKDVTGKIVKTGTPTIIHIGIKPKVEEEELDFKVVKRDNPELPKGQEKVVQEGEKGKKTTTTTYEVDPKTGKVTSKVTVDTKDPQDKIIEVGTKEEAKVVTPAPEAPKTPQAPAAPAPQVAKAELPNTGEKASSALMIAGLAMAAMTAGFVAKGRKEEN